jgi:hypothetical protein
MELFKKFLEAILRDIVERNGNPLNCMNKFVLREYRTTAQHSSRDPNSFIGGRRIASTRPVGFCL